MIKSIATIFIFFIFNFLVQAQGESISASVFGQMPEISNVRISPSGKRLLMIKRDGDKSIMFVRSLIDLNEPARGLPHSDGYYVWARWINDEQIIFRANMRRRSIRSGDVRNAGNVLFKMNWDGSGITVIDRRHVGNYLDVYKKDRRYFLTRRSNRVFKVDAETLEMEEYDDIYPDGRHILDKKHQVRVVSSASTGPGNKSIRKEFYRKRKGSAWIKLYEYSQRLGMGYTKDGEYERRLSFEGFTNDPSIIYVSSTRNDGKEALYTYSVDREEYLEVVASHEEYDLFNFQFDDDNQLKSYQYNGEYPVQVLVGDRGVRLAKIFAQAFQGSRIVIQNETDDETKVVVWVSSPTEPGTYYLLDLNTRKMEMIGYNYQNLDVDRLSNMKPVTYKARDGLEIPAYLSLPKGSDGKNLPTIIFPHDGPIDRVNWGFNTWTQFLTSRGYAVLQMNYRGSTGYGLDYSQKGFHEWGRKILEDINDGTKWMIEQGYTDPDKICTIGNRYGGYAALQVNALEPEFYKCAVTYQAIVDLRRYMNRIITNYIESKEWSSKEASPLHNADKIKVPILLFHGNRSEYAEKTENKLFISRLKKNGNDYKYISYDDVFKNNNVEFFIETEKFLEKYLKE